MDAQELRNLQEAYMDVYEERDTSHPHWETNRQFKKSKKKNKELIDAAQQRRDDRARNQNPLFFGPSGKMTKTKNEQVDLYDIILSHLLDEGYAETPEAAEAIMVNMSEEWRQSIVEGGFPGTPSTPRAGDAGTSGLKLIRTPTGQTGYINKHSGGEILPPDTVNKIMSGQLMVKKQDKTNTKTA